MPDGASAVAAVALVRGGLVALGALATARPTPGETALVTAASGMGQLAVQLARARGAARVVGAVSDPAKAAFVRSRGADAVVVCGDDVWGDPADHVLDAVGGELLTPALAALAPGGRLVAYSSGGGTIQAYDLLVGAKSVIGFQMARIARDAAGTVRTVAAGAVADVRGATSGRYCCAPDRPPPTPMRALTVRHHPSGAAARPLRLTYMTHRQT